MHRFFHTMQVLNSGPGLEKFQNSLKILLKLNRIAQGLFGVPGDINASADLFTMSSARRASLNHIGDGGTVDLEAELFAQWAITGRVKLTRFHYFESVFEDAFMEMMQAARGRVFEGL